MLNSSDPQQRTLTLIRQWRGLSPALARTSAQVSALSAEAAGDTAEALGNLLTFAAAQFNVGKNLTDIQIALLASEMLRLYWHWRFDEFSFVLREAVAGRYGTTYDRLDAATVHAWCATYEQGRNLLEADELEREAQQYKNPKPAPSPLAAEPGYAALRASLDALSDAELERGGSHYASLATPTPEQALKLAVATEVWQQREARRRLAALASSLPGRDLPTARDLYAQQQAQDHAVELAVHQGDYEAAGFKDYAGLQRLLGTAPPEPATGNVYPPACPRCLQRPDQCICPPTPPACRQCGQQVSACRCAQAPF